MQRSVVHAQFVERPRVVDEAGHVAPFEPGSQRDFHLFDEGRRAKQRVAPTGARVLHGGAVAHGDAAVLEFEQHGHAFTGLADRAEAGRDRLTFVDEAVRLRARPDRLLVVEEE